MAQELEYKASVIDHDHFCRGCYSYWGCSDEFCHLPTEELCPDHGGGWNSKKDLHVHTCLGCTEKTGEWVSNFDWVHLRTDCTMQRNWRCEEHRHLPQTAEDRGKLTPDFCSGGCGQFVIRPNIFCSTCAASIRRSHIRSEQWQHTPASIRLVFRVLQCLFVVGSMIALGVILKLLGPSFSYAGTHPGVLLLLIGAVLISVIALWTALRIHRNIYRPNASPRVDREDI